MTVVRIIGPPRRPREPRAGFPFVLPLEPAPPSEWQAIFSATEWTNVDPRLIEPYQPRLIDGVVWLPRIKNVAHLRAMLDRVADQISCIDAEYEDQQAEASAAAAARAAAIAQQEAAEDRALSEWWQSRNQS